MGKATDGKRTVAKRVARLSEKKPASLLKPGDRKSRKKAKLMERAKDISGLRKNKKFMDTIFNELVSADIMMKPEEFCLVWLVATFVPSGLAALLHAGLMPAATLAALGAFAPMFVIKLKKGKRLKTFENQLGDTLIMMCNSLRSGFSFQQAMESVASDMPAPIGVEFGRVCNEIRYGATLEDALNNLTDRVKSADLMLVVSVVCIQRTTGGNLSEILTTISETIKDRITIRGEVRSITAQGRTSGMIIGALPMLMAAALMILNPSYMNTFFTTSPGRIMLTISVVMEIIGFIAIRKVVTVEY